MDITTLGEPLFDSPLSSHVSDKARVLFNVVVDPDQPPSEEFLFELAGPREKIFFDPKKTRAGIVTCGGLCPGLNNVIRSLVLELHHGYGVREILGFVDGYQGLDPWRGSEPIPLTPEFVEDIHKEGGSILNTSRGPVDVSVAVDNLIRRKVNILFVVGGDGTQRGGAAIYKEASQRGHALAVVGVPKTIDNDVAFVSRTFGYLTAVEEATKVIDCAHTEAHSVHNGISIVKIMGRHAGFIAAGATVASQDVNFTLVPEVPGVPLEQNLIYRAAQLLKARSERPLGAHIQLTKRLPMGGGLGGGSSDAATTLVALNHLWHLGLREDELAQMGRTLGADVPVFVRGRTAFAEGVGEQLQPVEIPSKWYLVVHPQVHVSTAQIFQDPELKRDTPKAIGSN